jgi:predicted nucleotidyltransferase
LVVDFIRKDFHGSFDQFMDFKTDMELLFQRRVDLISQKTIRNEILRNEINSSKVLIYGA